MLVALIGSATKQLQLIYVTSISINILTKSRPVLGIVVIFDFYPWKKVRVFKLFRLTWIRDIEFYRYSTNLIGNHGRNVVGT